MNSLSTQDIDPSIKERVQYWLEANFDDETKKEIVNLIENDREGLIDAFYTTLTFGTGGLRGIMGAGSNRMNIYTIRWATQGLANYLKKEFTKNQELRVAIGYDSRHHSKSFAEESARVLAGNGIKVFLFPALRPTPLVSFACRYYKCQSAIMITASHNPPSYNGYKVYWDDGAQVLPPHDKSIINEVNCLHDPDLVSLASLSSPLITLMGSEVEEAYFKAIVAERLWGDEKNRSQLKILYSSLNGTGITMVPEALHRYGFTSIGYVEEQKEPNGDFPTTARPNPEEEAALRLGMKKLMKEEYDIFVATDPDADRMGVVVRHKGNPVILTGNQIACIAAEYVCRARVENGQMPKNGALVKSIVTTELFRAISKAHGASCFDVLTGFKFIAEKIREWESSGEFSYLFGAEESYGYLLGTHARDKDAVIATCMISEIANLAKNEGKTLVDFLEELYRAHGVYREGLVSLEFQEGKEGSDRIKEIMQRLRMKAPTTLAGHAVTRIGDLLISKWKYLKDNREESILLPKSDVLILELEDQSKIVIRPSGTEPKMKIYLMVKEKGPGAIEELIIRADEKAATFGKELKAFIE